MEAELVSVMDGVVVLKKENGKVIRVPIEKLSEADRKYLMDLDSDAPVNSGQDDPKAIAALEKKEFEVELNDDGRVVSVDFGYEDATNADVALVKSFSQLERLNVYSDGLTKDVLDDIKHLKNLRELQLPFAMADEDIAKLAGLTKLRRLEFYSSNLTNKSVKVFGTMPDLERLDLNYSEVTAEAIDDIAKLVNLKVLYMSGITVSDADMEKLKNLTKLEEFEFEDDELTEEGYLVLSNMKNLKNLTELSTLSLRETKISDIGMIYLADLGKLSSLNIAETDISNDGLLQLRGLKQLSYVDAEETKVTKAGADKLKEALPDVSIYH